MEMTKSKKLLRKKKRKKIFGDFFPYDVIQERACFRAFLTPIFNNFFRTAFKQKFRLQVNLVRSFGDISKPPRRIGHFYPPPPPPPPLLLPIK